MCNTSDVGSWGWVTERGGIFDPNGIHKFAPNCFPIETSAKFARVVSHHTLQVLFSRAVYYSRSSGTNFIACTTIKQGKGGQNTGLGAFSQIEAASRPSPRATQGRNVHPKFCEVQGGEEGAETAPGTAAVSPQLYSFLCC